MDNDRIDFSALDPKRDRARFERMVQAVVAGAKSPTEPPLLVLELVRWGRAAMAAATLLAFAAWMPSLVRGGSVTGENPAASGSDPVELVSLWAETGKVPADIDLIQALGGLRGH